MSAKQTYVIVCDGCKNVFVDLTYRGAAAVRVTAAMQGWGHTIIPRAKGQPKQDDRCPACRVKP